MNLLKNDIPQPNRFANGLEGLSSGAVEPQKPSSPCIKVCAVSGQLGLCIGCGRTLPEIAGWGRMSEAERLALMAVLPDRLANIAAD